MDAIGRLGRRYRLTGARVPSALAALDGAPAGDGLLDAEIGVEDGRFREAAADWPAVDLGGRIVLPGLVDAHVHLDKGHVWPRRANPDGTLAGALDAARADRRCWTTDDLARRMEFSLRAAWAHGTVALRTHLDTDTADEASWDVFAAARERWAGRLALQAASLSGPDAADCPGFGAMADRVAAEGGVLGAVVVGAEGLDARLDRFLDAAGTRGLDVDFHADETTDPGSRGLDAIARAVSRTGFRGRVLAGHACALATQPEDEAMATLDRVAEAGVDLVSLPLCNLYLQDRAAGRTPRLRGVTLVHEAKARGVRVAFASDNTRDPFHPGGDLDMLAVWREASRIAHLDHPVGDWPAAFAATPALMLGVEAGSIAPGRAADLVVTEARDWSEFRARPQTGRVVIRDGARLDAAPPDYADLDDLVGRA
ncbi:MAG: cytosine deaminase [Paracoccaceae bacterium]